ncbi:MAG: ATP-dependent DNA ligase [Opitutales bacterium]|nr:ATP-dependent DNA ligase [Opitutales bacterium]
MRRFERLFRDLEESNKTSSKVGAMVRYFREVPPEDAVWALWFLTGHRFPALVRSKNLRLWTGDLSGYPDWLIDECYERVGDVAETAALLLPLEGPGTEQPLGAFIGERVEPLAHWREGMQLPLLRETWSRLNRDQAFLFHKLLTGGFRVGVSKTLVVRALAEALGVDRAVMAHRLAGKWKPTAAFFRSLGAAESRQDDASRPYPFFLASPLQGAPDDLGERAEWIAEWKWDGIRCQLLHREKTVFLWSRGDELITESFPEVAEAARSLPSGTVLDGELLCWGETGPRDFNALQTRISRKALHAALLRDFPVRFLAYDCLECAGEDVRSLSLNERLNRLERVLAHLPADSRIHRSPVVEETSWADLTTRWGESRARGVEGLMLKRRNSPYAVGRVQGDWWKWKVDPFTADLVMIYAQAGHGRRAGLYTDYTFAARAGERFLPVARAYSGLTDKEIREVDRWIKDNTLAKRGPVRTVPAQWVFEIAFEGIRESNRHKSGLALRFPRILRWRKDKSTAEADSLDQLRALLRSDPGPAAP